jgi:hypothetical protein
MSKKAGRGKPAEGKTRRKKNQYIEYDYEALYNQNVEDWDEYFIEQLLKNGKVSSVYATKETYAGDQLEIEIYPEFTKQQAEAEGIKPVNKKKQQEAQRELNSKNSRKRFWRLAEHNFNNGDYWLTFTYAKEPKDIDEAIANMQRFIRNVNGKRRRRGMPNAKYLYVTEEVSEDGEVVRIHHHLFMDNLLDLDTVTATWKYGGRNEYRHIEKDENGIKGAATYMTKPAADTKRKKYRKRWNGSTNLEQPPQKKHHQTKTKDINRMVKDREYIREYVETVRTRSGKKRYDGYTYSHCSIYFNDVNARYYIRVRMRKGEKSEDGKTHKETERAGTNAVYGTEFN